MKLPSLPGIYVVELLNKEPISVNADRPSIANRCIKVTHANCKYGQAVNLARRQREYIKTFGAENVRFCFFVVTELYAAVEVQLATRLMRFRIPGATGRLNEWLQGITAAEVVEIVKEELSSVGDSHPASPQSSSESPLNDDPLSHEPLGVIPRLVVEAARYLQGQGMSANLLRDMHHSPRRDETFGATLRYFSEKQNLRQNNLKYGARLIYVAERHRKTGRGFGELVREALQCHPM